LEKPSQRREPNDQNDHTDDQGQKRPGTASSPAGAGTAASHRYWTNRFRFGRILEIGIAVNGQSFRGLKRLQVWRYIHFEKLSVDNQKTLRISETRELRKIFVLDVIKLGWPDLRQPAGFIEREAAGEPGFL